MEVHKYTDFMCKLWVKVGGKTFAEISQILRTKIAILRKPIDLEFRK